MLRNSMELEMGTDKQPEQFTVEGFLDYFLQIHTQMKDRSFAFILGAGASRTSGILTGAELVSSWLSELHKRMDSKQGTRPLEQWATAENLQVSGFEYKRAEEFYPEIFERRFRDDPDEGYAYLETIMEGKESSFGYSVLAQIAEKERHRVFVTTNFDNLIADALSIYTRTYPLVCGHESLTGFVRARMRRPLVVKIHRDLLLGPKSTTEEIARLDPSWDRALRVLFQHHSPIVIGYGGNDGSLMGFLEKLEPGSIVGRLLWCYKEMGGLPNDRIRNVVARHHGALIPILGFDEIMLLLGARLGFGLLAEDIEQRSRDRADRYRKSVELIQTRLSSPVGDVGAKKAKEDVRRALSATVERQGTWWTWALRAQAEPDIEKREQIYLTGLNEFPDSALLIDHFATFLTNIRKNHDEAERLYRRALELEPNDSSNSANLALFLSRVRKSHEEAERLYQRSLELDPNNARIIGNFASFLTEVHKNYEEAERHYRHALELEPSHVNNIANFETRVRGQTPLFSAESPHLDSVQS